MTSKREGFRIIVYCSILVMHSTFIIDKSIHVKRRFMSSFSSDRMENPSDLVLASPVAPLIKLYASQLKINDTGHGIESTRFDHTENDFATQFEDIFTGVKTAYPNFVALLIKDGTVYCRRSQLKSLSRGKYFIQMLEQGLLQYRKNAQHRNHHQQKRHEVLLNSTAIVPVLLKHDDSNGCYPARQYDKYKVPRLTWSVPFNNENRWCAAIGMPSYKAWRDASKSVTVDENYWKNEFRKNHKQYPWATKLNMAVWRGSTTFNKGLYGRLGFDEIPRAKLVEKGKESDLIDAAFHKLVGKYEDETQTRMLYNFRDTLKEGIPLKDMMRYKGKDMQSILNKCVEAFTYKSISRDKPVKLSLTLTVITGVRDSILSFAAIQLLSKSSQTL